jgi:LPXTG-site transpeptidase (sortase) family protein
MEGPARSSTRRAAVRALLAAGAILALGIGPAAQAASQSPVPAQAAAAPRGETAPWEQPLGASPPSIGLNVPGQVPVGQDVSFSVTFDNGDAVAPGYGPILDVILDTTGADAGAGGGPFDGLGTTSITASYLGIAFTTASPKPTMWVLTFDASGEATHPLMRDASGAYITVNGTPGDTLVVLRLPFGSFTADQPPATVDMTVNMSAFADVGTPLSIQARGGYQFGYNPLDDWCCGDAGDATFSGFVSTSVTPTLVTLAKSYAGPESEAATGPNFRTFTFYALRYTVTATIAPGQSLTSLSLSDTLPSNLQFYSLISSSPGGATCTLPGTAPGGSIDCSFPAAVSGSASLTFDFYVPRDNASGGRVLNPLNGDDVTSCDNASATGTWVPLDPRDTGGPVTVNPGGCEHTLTDKSIAVQKSVVNLSGANAPGALLEYTLRFQVSDFFAFGGVTLSDVVSDGQHVEGTPTLEVEGNGFSLPVAAMASANYSVACDYTGGPGPECTIDDSGLPNTGDTTLTFRVSDELVSRGESGQWVGGCVDPVRGSANPDCNPANPGGYNDGPTYATLHFRARIQNAFTDDYPSGDPSVDQGDVLENDVGIAGNLLDTGTLLSNGFSEADASGAGLSIGTGSLGKSVYAVNGGAPGDPVRVKPGDTVTYRLTYTLPISDVENLEFKDYLPLPVFHVGDPDEVGGAGPAWLFDPMVSAAVPGPGVAKFGPDDTFYTYTCAGLGTPAGCLAPTLTSDTVNNRLRFYYGDFNDPRHQATTVDLLFTLVVSDDPFADWLYLTNQVNAFEGSTNAGTVASDAIRQIVLTEPVLHTTKGVIWTGNVNSAFDPMPAGPVAFLAPSSAPRWSGVINSTNLAAAPINSNVTGVDAGDIVTFAIAVENTGSSLKGAFDLVLRDDLPAPYQIPAAPASLNLQVYYGNGSGPIAYNYPIGGPACTGVWPGDPCGLDGTAGTMDDLFGYGIELVDPAADQGVCQAHDPNLGNNVILITYDLQLGNTTGPGTVINTASLVGYAGSEGGPNHLARPQTDTAETTIAGTPAKALVGTEINNAVNGSGQAVIGELVTYRLTLTVPEGVTPDAQIVDTLDPGLAFVRVDSVTLSTDLTAENTIGTGTSPANVTVGGTGNIVTFNPGDLTNTNRDNTVPETLEVVYTAVVLDVSGNHIGTLLNNSAVHSWNGGSLPAVSASEVTVIEPVLAVDKTAVVNGLGNSGDAGDPVAYTITLRHAGTSATDAFDVELTDVLPRAAGGQSLIAGPTLAGVTDTDGILGAASFSLTGADATGYTLSTVAPFDLPLMPVNPPTRIITLTITGTLAVYVEPGTFANTAVGTWTSLDGTPGVRSTYSASSTERTGTYPIVQPNDYTDTGVAPIVVQTSPQKLIVATSEAHTGNVGGVEYLAIGEIARYRLTAILPEGTSTNLQIVDLLPQGMLLLDNGEVKVSFTADNNVLEAADLAGADNDAIPPTFVLPAVRISTTAVGTRQQVTFSLGNLVNQDNDPEAEIVTLEFNALVDNSLAGSNDAGDNRDNSYSVWVGGVQVSASTAVQTRIAEPAITNLTKTVLAPAPQDAGDTANFRITYSNPAGLPNTTAFEARLTDTLDADLTLNLASINVTLGGGAAGVTNASVGNTVDVTIATVPAGGSVQIDFTATVVNNVLVGVIIPNEADLVYTSLPGPNGTLGNPTGSETPGATGMANGERGGTLPAVLPNDYSDVGTVNINLTDPAVAKSVAATSVASTTSSEHNISLPDLVIGEEATFEIVVTLPEGQADPLIITDSLPTMPAGALEHISSAVISVGANVVTTLLGTPIASDSNGDGINDRITFDFGSATNVPDGASDAKDQIVLQVVARLTNIAGNQDAVTHTNQATLTTNIGSTSATARVEVVEPVLQITKAADDDTPALGQTITYTLTVSHAPASTADAQDVVVTDTAPAGLAYVPASASAPAGWTVNDSGAPVLVFSGSLTQAVGSVSFSYEATLGVPPIVTVGQTFTNTVNATWTSIAGSDSSERTGSGAGPNDYAVSADETVTASEIDLTLAKTDGGISAVPGQTYAYTLTIRNIGNLNATAMAVTDAVPDHTTFDAAGSSPGWTCVPDNNAPSVCTLVVGNLAAGTTLPLTFSVTVDSTLPVLVTQTSNTASVEDSGEPAALRGNNSGTDTTPLDAAPDLVIAKNDSLSIVSPGQTLTYVLAYSNAGDQDAAGVVISETVPNGTTFTGPSGWSCTIPSPGGTPCDYAVGNLAAGTGGTVDFVVVVNDPAGVASVVNTATITDDGSNGPDQNPADNTSTDMDNLVTLPDADLTKDLSGTSQAHTTGQLAAIGEILTYRVVMTIPQGTMGSATITDVLDRGLAFVECLSLTPSTGLTTTGDFAAACAAPTVAEEPGGSGFAEDAGRRIAFDLGDMTSAGPGDATLTLIYRAVVIDNAGNVRGGNLNNRASWTWVGGQLIKSADEVTLVEPTLTLSKTAAPMTAPPGAPITFTLTINQDAASDSAAFDLRLEDVVPLGLIYVPGSLAVTSGPPATVDESGAPTLIVRWDDLGLGETATVQFEATMGNLGPGQGVTNLARLEWTSLPDDAPASLNLSSYNMLAAERRYDPANGVDLYGVTAAVTVSVPRLPATGFTPGRVTELQGTSRLADLGELTLEIPTLKVSIPIVGVPADEEGWDLTWLAAQAGYLEGTAYPTHRGNSALTAHVTLPNGRPGPFARLVDLHWGDRIVVHAYGLRYTYEVRTVTRTTATDLRFLGHKDQSWLTLITCRSYDEAAGEYLYRVIVQAVLTEVAED